MKKHVFAAAAAVLVLGSVSIANAAAVACRVTYPHPAKAKKISSSLVQAFVSCNNPGGNTPNATTETGTTPTCYPAETYHQQALSPPLGWLWGPKSSGTITFQASKNKVVHPLNPTTNVSDLSITVKISNILDNTGDADGTNGNVQSVARATLIDRAADQLMTVIDFPTGFGIPVTGGKVNKKTSATVILNNLSQPALPSCTTIELISTLVKDPNGNTFANLGTFLPGVP
jgi:hypothetical protein